MEIDYFDPDQAEELAAVEEGSSIADLNAADAERFPQEFPSEDRGMIDLTLSTFNTAAIKLYSKYSNDIYEFEVDVRELLERTKSQLEQNAAPKMRALKESPWQKKMPGTFSVMALCASG